MLKGTTVDDPREAWLPKPKPSPRADCLPKRWGTGLIADDSPKEAKAQGFSCWDAPDSHSSNECQVHESLEWVVILTLSTALW